MLKRLKIFNLNINKLIFNKPTILCIFLLFLFLLIYLPILSLPFGWDDLSFLYDAHFSGIPTIYKGFISSYVSRPLTREIIWVIGELFTYNNPFIYRTVNILLLLLTGLIFFKLLIKHFKFTLFEATLIITIFLSHYVTIELLRWVSFAQDIYAVFFLFLAWFFILDFTKKPGKVSYMLSVMSFLGVMLSKEVYAFFPIVLGLYWFFWKKYTFKKTIRRLYPFLIILALYSLGRIIFMKPITKGYAAQGSIIDTWSNFGSLILWVIPYSSNIIGVKSIPVFFTLLLIVCLCIIHSSKIKAYLEQYFILIFWGLSTLLIIISRHQTRTFWYSVGFIMPFYASLIIPLKIIRKHFNFKQSYWNIIIIFICIYLIIISKNRINHKYLNRENFCQATRVGTVACSFADIFALKENGYSIKRVLLIGQENKDFENYNAFPPAQKGLKYLFDNDKLIVDLASENNLSDSLNYDLIVRYSKQNTYQIENFSSKPLTNQEIIQKIISESPILKNNQQKSEFDTVVAIREWVYNNIPYTEDGMLLENAFRVPSASEIPLNIRLNIFNNGMAGATCGGTAQTLRDIYRLFGYESYLLNMGNISEKGSPATHVVTLVKIKNKSTDLYSIQDPYFNYTSVDSNGEPIGYFELLNYLKNKSTKDISMYGKNQLKPRLLKEENNKLAYKVEKQYPNGMILVRLPFYLEKNVLLFYERMTQFLKKRGYPENLIFMYLFPFQIYGDNIQEAEMLLNRARATSGYWCFPDGNCWEF